MAKSVRDTMTTQPASVDRSKPISDAARVMRDENVGSLPVVEEGRLIGVITDRDIVIRLVAEGRDLDSATVGEAYSDQPVTVEPDQDLDDALRLMARYQVRRLPVAEGDRLVGILAQADVALEEKEKATGEVVQAISEPSGPTAAG
jgi:CBS domain-containing protein